jgi:uncharacterized protein YecE (DUF72 family)
VRLYSGTSGYSYPEWKGTFYPEKLKTADMLRDYASKLDAVEINSSFYRIPRRSTLEKWASEVPDHFRFVLKATKRITHEKMLKECQDTVDYMLGVFDVLGAKLGPVMFQLHPRLRADADLLARFLDGLPKGRKYAFELQHESWADPAIDPVLRAHDAARVFVHGEKDPPAPEGPLSSNATWGYLRLRACEYAGGDLEAWKRAMDAAGWAEGYAFFKHEEEMTGPAFAVGLRALAAHPTPASFDCGRTLE